MILSSGRTDIKALTGGGGSERSRSVSYIQKVVSLYVWLTGWIHTEMITRQLCGSDIRKRSKMETKCSVWQRNRAERWRWKTGGRAERGGGGRRRACGWYWRWFCFWVTPGAHTEMKTQNFLLVALDWNQMLTLLLLAVSLTAWLFYWLSTCLPVSLTHFLYEWMIIVSV